MPFCSHLILTVALFSLFSPIHCREIKIFNFCPFPTWPAIQGPGNPSGGGFKLEFNQTKSIFVDDDWKNGKIWPRTRCDKKMKCATGHCGDKEQCNGASGEPPFSLAEISLGGEEEGTDFYNVTLENGYNIPVLIDAYGGEGVCGRAGGCVKDPNQSCKKDLSVIRGGWTVGCKTDCEGQEQCKKSETVKMFKESCSGAFSHRDDDKKLTRTCTGAAYVVQFC